MQFIELGFGIEEIHLAGSPLHENADAILGPGREVRKAWRQRIQHHASLPIGRGAGRHQEPLLREHGSQRHHAQTAGGGGQKFPAGLGCKGVHGGHRDGVRWRVILA